MRHRAQDPKDLRPVRRPWDNTGLRHRVEGRAIDGVDVSQLQVSVASRHVTSHRRRGSGAR